MVKINNEKMEGAIITIKYSRRLGKVFLDICRPFPRSGGRQLQIHSHYLDHFTKLYPISKASTKVIIKIIVEKHIVDTGVLESVITDHGTPFKGRWWREEMINKGIKPPYTIPAAIHGWIYFSHLNISQPITPRQLGSLSIPDDVFVTTTQWYY